MNTKIRNKHIFIKGIINFFIIILGAILVSSVVKSIQQVPLRNNFVRESKDVLSSICESISVNTSDAKTLEKIYHDLNQSTVDDLSEIAGQGMFDGIDDMSVEMKTDIFSEIVGRTDSPYLFLMNDAAVVIAAPKSYITGTDLVKEGLLTKENFDSLIDPETDVFYIREENETGSYYFYASRVELSDRTYYLVYGTDAKVLDTQLNSLTNVSDILWDATIGKYGYAFAVDTTTGQFIFYNDEVSVLTGKSYLEYGLTEEALVDGYQGKQKVDGADIYCVSKKLNDEIVVISAVDISELYQSGSYAWKLSIASFVAVSIICLIYAEIVRNDYLYNDRDIKKKYICEVNGENYFLNISVLKRMLPVAILGVVFMFIVSFYAGTILEINQAVEVSNSNIRSLEENFEEADSIKDVVSDYYESQFLSKAKLLAYIFETNPSALNIGAEKTYYEYNENGQRVIVKDGEGNDLKAVANSQILARYCADNYINGIYIFDDQGNTIATNLNDWYFTLSMDPSDQSYPFRDILDQKIDHYIQDMMTDEQGRVAQYIGTTFNYYTTTDLNGDTLYVSQSDYQAYMSGDWNGNKVTKHTSLLQIGLNTDVMESILDSTEYEYVLEKASLNDTYLVLFDNTQDHTILYSPVETSIGKTADEIGLKNNAFNGNYIGFHKANGIQYLLSIQYYKGYFIGTAVLNENLFVSRASIAFTTALFGLVFIMLMYLLVILTSEEEDAIYSDYAKSINNISDRIMFMISTPTGSTTVTEKAVSRWDNKNIPWSEKTPEQKLLVFLYLMMLLLIVYVIVFITLITNGTIENNVFSFILTGNWDKGFNIFALTGCCLVLTFAVVLSQVLYFPIRLVTSIFGTKSETIGHLLASVVKYTASIVCIFYCLYLLGFDSSSLIASAGILSLVIGLGSQSLIKDVVAGIFIIFEGSFRVGDIVTIGGYRGQVLDVGLRTTKIMAADHNIKIINNSDVNGVINMTRVLSLCSIEMPVSVDKNVKEVENILNRDLPSIKDKVGGILDGPYYTGITNANDKNFTIEISALCQESDIKDVKTGLYREVLDLLNINNLSK